VESKHWLEVALWYRRWSRVELSELSGKGWYMARIMLVLVHVDKLGEEEVLWRV